MLLIRMREFIAKMDRGLILVIFLSLAAAWPFLLRSSLPSETDAELHIFRAAELGYSLRALEFYPRWAPDFYYGYGYPIFNYYAPLTYYLANLLSLTIPGGAVFGSKLVFILAFLMAGTGTFALARLYAGSKAGVVAASSYLFAPYVYMFDPHLRGDLAEFLALGIAPVALWSVAAFQRDSTRRHLMLASLLPTALILSHNLLGLAFFGLLAGQWLWLTILHRPKLSTAAFHALPLILAVSLSAFFWIPVALESSAVQLHNLVGPGHFDFREHFLTSSELFAPSLPLDLGSMNPAFRFNLGLAQWVLGLLGVIALGLNLRDSRLRTGGFWLLSSIMLIILMLRFSLLFWETVPIMPFFQFPWRLLGPAALCLALLGGYSVYLLPRVGDRMQSGLFALSVVLPILSALPIWSPPSWTQFGATDQEAMLEFELGGFALGTTSTGDFVPSTVGNVPPPTESVIESYRSDTLIDRVNREIIPPTASVDLIRQRPTSDLFETQSDQAFTLQLYRFMFPGWKATIDGEPIELEHTEPNGFMQLSIPAGEHEVRVWLGLTMPRIIASVISVAALITLIGVAVIRQPSTQPPVDQPLFGDGRITAYAISLCLLITLAGSLMGVWQPRSEGLIAIPADRNTHHFFEGGIDFIGFDFDNTPLQPGDELPITLYWKAREPVPSNYQVFLHLTTVPEHIWGQSDKLNPGDYPTTRWPLDKYLRDPHSFIIPLGTPPGTYEVRVGLWNRSTGYRQLVLEQDGTILGDSLSLPIRVEVQPAIRQPMISDLPLDVVIQTEVIDGITLIGADLDPDGVFTAPLGHLAVRLYWLSNSGSLPDYQVALRLVAADGTVAAETEEQITDGLFPSSRWQPATVIRDIHTIWIDQNIPAGTYSLEIRLANTTESEWVKIIEITRE